LVWSYVVPCGPFFLNEETVASYEIFIAKRYLRAKRKTRFISITTYISIVGVGVGVATLIIVLSLMNGFATEVRAKLIGMDAHLRVLAFHGEGITDYLNLGKKIEEVEGVVATAPFIYWEGMLASTGRTAGVKIKGIEPSSATRVTEIGESLIDGELNLREIQGEKCSGIVIGKFLADRLRVGVGDEVYLLSSKSIDVASMWSIPKMRRFLVTGIFESGLYDFDASLAFMSIETAQQIFGLDNKVTGIEVKINDIYKAKPIGGKIRERLGYPYFTLDWMEMNKHLFSWMTIEKWASFIVLSLIIVVAAFSIISTLIMIVMEKTREIGILRSMGATAKSIKKIFISEGLVIGILGTALGCLIGYLFCWVQDSFKVISLPSDIYIISAVPIDMRPFDFIWVSAAALGICFLASLYPARKAASLEPVEAIRYE